jgi:hypothetical protein
MHPTPTDWRCGWLSLSQNLQTSHGRKAMLKYMLLLANSATACEKFSKDGEVHRQSQCQPSC